MDVFKSIVRFLLRRDSEGATILCIDLAHHMSQEDRRQIADYMESLNEYDAKYGRPAKRLIT